MNFKFKQLATLALILSWLFAQNILLAHEYSSEHLSQTESHICLSHINDNDDLMVGQTKTADKKLSPTHYSYVRFKSVELSQIRYFVTRAPPFSLS